MITVQYACTRRQFKIGRKLLAAPGLNAVRQRRRTLRLRSFFGWILFSIVTGVFLQRIPPSRSPLPAPPLYALWGSYVSVAGMILIFTGMRLFRWSGWPAFRQKSRQLSLGFSQAGVEQRWPGVRTLLQWDHFTGLAERKGVYTLRERDGAGIIVPQSLFAPADLPQIDQLLKEKLAARVPLLAAGFEVRPR